MKIVNLFIILSLFMVGCDEGNRGTNLDGSTSWGTFTKKKFEGHTYIIYKEGFGDVRFGGLEHDPECFLCRNRR